MAIKTISELKALWVNGFIPDEDDYIDLFDTLEAGDYGYKVNEVVFTNQDFIFDTPYEIVPAQGAGSVIVPWKIEIISNLSQAYSFTGANSMIPQMQRISDDNYEPVTTLLDGSSTRSYAWIQLDFTGKKFKTLFCGAWEFSSEKYDNKPLVILHSGGSNTGGAGTITIRTYYKVI